MVADGAQLGDRVELQAGAYVGHGATIGSDSVVMAGAVLYHDVEIGERCVIHSGAVIGADGFGFIPDERGEIHAVAQLGSVTVGDDVVVGASTTIDRGAIENTTIGNGVKIDNQVQIGHNCRIGDNTLICGCVGLSGSTTVGKNCVLAGAVGVAGDGPITITDGVIVSAMTFVGRSISDPGVYSGGLLHNTNPKWRRNMMRFHSLDDLAKRIADIEAKLSSTDRD